MGGGGGRGKGAEEEEEEEEGMKNVESHASSVSLLESGE